MKRIWTIIGVADAPSSFRWYQSLLGLPETAPARDYFGEILDSDGTVLLCFHEWGAHGHPSLMSPRAAAPGNGLLLFFRVDDFDRSLPRARALVPGPNARAVGSDILLTKTEAWPICILTYGICFALGSISRARGTAAV